MESFDSSLTGSSSFLFFCWTGSNCILLNLSVDFDKLQEAGAMMGSGGLIVMDDRTCMVDVAKYYNSERFRPYYHSFAQRPTFIMTSDI